MPVGSSQLIMIMGGLPPYSVTSLNPSLTSPASWTVSSSGGTFQVTGAVAGAATLIINDAVGNSIQLPFTITSQATQSLQVIPASPTVAVGGSILLMLTGGASPYSITSLNPSLTTPVSWTVNASGGTFQVTGAAAGTGTLAIRDATGSTIQAPLTVTSQAQLQAVPSSASITVDEPQIIVVTGGTAPYTVTSLNPSLTTPTTWSVTTSGGMFQVTGAKAGAALINIVDSVGNQFQVSINIS